MQQTSNRSADQAIISSDSVDIQLLVLDIDGTIVGESNQNGLLSYLRELYTPAELYLTTSVATFFEATHPLVNKGAAVRYLVEEILGLKAVNGMTIGEDFNDIEMLRYAGLDVAIGNAPEDVKAVANWVAPCIELDSAAAIEQFVL